MTALRDIGNTLLVDAEPPQKKLHVEDEPPSSETESETLSSSSHGCSDDLQDDDNDSVCLVQHKRPQQQQPSRLVGRCFGAALEAARANQHQTTLEFHNFIERSTRHDILGLRDLLLQDDRQWESITLVDRAYASNFRRWAYKKENVSHHLQRLCVQRNIRLDYQVHLELNVDDLPTSSVVALLAEIKKHPEIRHLVVVGHLTASQAPSDHHPVIAIVEVH